MAYLALKSFSSIFFSSVISFILFSSSGVVGETVAAAADIFFRFLVVVLLLLLFSLFFDKTLELLAEQVLLISASRHFPYLNQKNGTVGFTHYTIWKFGGKNVTKTGMIDENNKHQM